MPILWPDDRLVRLDDETNLGLPAPGATFRDVGRHDGRHDAALRHTGRLSFRVHGAEEHGKPRCLDLRLYLRGRLLRGLDSF